MKTVYDVTLFFIPIAISLWLGWDTVIKKRTNRLERKHQKIWEAITAYHENPMKVIAGIVIDVTLAMVCSFLALGSGIFTILFAQADNHKYYASTIALAGMGLFAILAFRHFWMAIYSLGCLSQSETDRDTSKKIGDNQYKAKNDEEGSNEFTADSSK